MEPIKENPNENINQPEAVEQNPMPEPEAPVVESEPAAEEKDYLEEQPAVEEVVEDGQVYQAPPHDDSSVSVNAHAERLAPLPEEEKLWQLKLLARDHSLEKAISVLKKMNDPWLEDKFHDDLMDDPEWRKQLEALGKIEKL